MLDLGEARAALDAAKASGGPGILVEPVWLEQALSELEAGRQAQARQGEIFALKGQRL